MSFQTESQDEASQLRPTTSANSKFLGLIELVKADRLP